MIHLCFDGNVASALRAARACAGAHGERFGDILCFPDNLTIGRLLPLTAKRRRAELSRIMGFSNLGFEKDWNEFHDRLPAADGDVRVWSTDATHEQVALCYASSLMGARQAEVRVLSRKLHETMDWDSPLPIPTVDTYMVDCLKCAGEWDEVVASERSARSPRIRIIEDGRIRSVGEDHFDALIGRCLAKLDFDDLPFLLTDEIERETGNLIVPEFLSIRLCRILGYGRNPWCPAVEV